jgi:peptidoglycan hydrolase-like protein with peptidoglycan-binding domain
MAGLTEEDIKNLGALTEAPKVDPLGKSPSSEIEMEEVETLGGTIKKLPSRITGKLEEGYGKDIVAEQEYLPEKILAGVAKGADVVLGPLARGFNRTLAFLPDAALNAITSGFNAATGSDIDKDILLRIFNSKDFESQRVLIPYILNYGVDGYVGSTDQDSAYERYTGAVGEGVAVAVPIVGASTKYAQTAQQLPRIGQYAQNTGLGTAVLDTITKPFVKSPLLATGVETGLSAVSSIGMQAEEDLFGTQTGLGALLPFGGPAIYYSVKSGVVTPVTWAGKKVFSKGADIRDNIRVESGTVDPKSGKRGDEAQVVVDQQLKDAAAGNEANIERSIEIETQLQPYAKERIVFSPAEATLDAPTLKTQASLEQSGTPEFTRKNIKRKENILKSISNFVNAKFTGNSVDDAPLFIYDSIKNRYNLTLGRINKGENELSTKISVMTNSDTGVYPQIANRTVDGQEIRQVISAAHTQAKENAESLAKNLNINNADQVASMDALEAAKTAVREAVTSKTGEASFSYPGLNKTVKSFIENTQTKITFQDWKMFRDQVSSQIGKAFATNNKADQRSLAILAKSLDDMGEAFGRTNVKFKDFQTYYDQHVIRPFETSQVIKILAKGRGGSKDRPVYYLADEQVSKAFLKDSNTAKQFMTLFGDNPSQLNNIRAAVLDEIRAVGVASGEFKPNAINKYMNSNRETLTELGLFDELSDTQNLVTQVVARQASLENRRKIINQNSMYSTMARAMKVENPEKLIDDLLRSPKLAREVKSKLGKDPEILEAFRAAVMQKALGKDPDALVDPYAFKKFLVENHRALDNVFDKSHLDNMYLVADAAERVFATPIVSGKGIQSQDIMSRFASKFGATVPGLSTRFIAQQEGRIGSKAVGAYVLARGISARSAARADALFKEMMFDPEVAKALVKEGPQPFSITPESNRQINSILFNMGIMPFVQESIGAESPAEDFQIEFPKAFELPEKSELPPVNLPKPYDKTNPFLFDQETGEQYGSNTLPPAPVANTQQTNTQTASASDLFPFDPTLAAIEKRQNAKKGIMSVT